MSWDFIFPTRDGGTVGSSIENRMLNKVGGANTTRTEIRSLPDGSEVMLRTRGGHPEFTVKKAVKAVQGVYSSWAWPWHGVLTDVLGTFETDAGALIVKGDPPYTWDHNFLVSSGGTPAAIPPPSTGNVTGAKWVNWAALAGGAMFGQRVGTDVWMYTTGGKCWVVYLTFLSQLSIRLKIYTLDNWVAGLPSSLASKFVHYDKMPTPYMVANVPSGAPRTPVKEITLSLPAYYTATTSEIIVKRSDVSSDGGRILLAYELRGGPAVTQIPYHPANEYNLLLEDQWVELVLSGASADTFSASATIVKQGSLASGGTKTTTVDTTTNEVPSVYFEGWVYQGPAVYSLPPPAGYYPGVLYIQSASTGLPIGYRLLIPCDPGTSGAYYLTMNNPYPTATYSTTTTHTTDSVWVLGMMYDRLDVRSEVRCRVVENTTEQMSASVTYATQAYVKDTTTEKSITLSLSLNDTALETMTYSLEDSVHTNSRAGEPAMLDSSRSATWMLSGLGRSETGTYTQTCSGPRTTAWAFSTDVSPVTGVLVRHPMEPTATHYYNGTTVVTTPAIVTPAINQHNNFEDPPYDGPISHSMVGCPRFYSKLASVFPLMSSGTPSNYTTHRLALARNTFNCFSVGLMRTGVGSAGNDDYSVAQHDPIAHLNPLGWTLVPKGAISKAAYELCTNSHEVDNTYVYGTETGLKKHYI